MGKPSLGIGIRKARGSNAVSVAENVKAKMKEIKATLPAGTNVGINFDTTKFIKESVHELIFTLVLAAILTAIVCWGLSWFLVSNSKRYTCNSYINFGKLYRFKCNGLYA